MKKQIVNLNRRSFLRLAGLAGAGSVLAAAGGTVLFSERFNRELHQSRQTRPLMGTYVQITVLDKSAAKAEEALNSAFAEMSRLENILSRFHSASPLSVLNSTGRLNGAPAELMEVLAASRLAWRNSGGAFDITVLPLLTAVESRVRANQSLSGAEALQAGDLVGMEKLKMSGTNLAFDRSGMGITLDGIAKGYIVDHAVASLSRQGISRALVNAGGDIRALGDKGEGKGWTIKVQDPVDKNAFVAEFAITDRAVATSGNYEAYFDEAKLFGHLINPERPGEAGDSLSSTILASSCTVADAMATAWFVMGGQNGSDMLAGQSDLGGLFLEQGGEQRRLRFPA
ncbi:MAG: FAD:protein FMN transferase [Desulfarculales bacterium]|jgi:thiamine biosynthesis lipoprotein|nr:FAD:protein FMN transferase [Desulfarculales bacterium]